MTLDEDLQTYLEEHLLSKEAGLFFLMFWPQWPNSTFLNMLNALKIPGHRRT